MELNSKQRSALRGIANSLEPIAQLGKGGVSESVLQQLNDALEAREMIKISVLRNCDETAKGLIDELAKQLRAEPVQAVGGKIILYRKSHRKDVKHLEF